jgi:hypothetical protein
MAGDPERSRRRRRALAPLLGEDRARAVESLLMRRAEAWVAAMGATGDDDGQTVLVWPELPIWQPDAGPAALSDLAAGCVASAGPVFEGELYLLAFAEPIPGLTDLPAPTMARVFAAVEQRRLEIGLLRAERGLRDADDVRALLADPMTDAELSGLLG